MSPGDITCLVVFLLVGLFVLLIVASIVRGTEWQRRQAERFKRGRREREEEKTLGELAAKALYLRRLLPYIPPFVVQEMSLEQAVESLVRTVSEETPIGEIAGTGIPVPPLPEQERRRQSLCHGKDRRRKDDLPRDADLRGPLPESRTGGRKPREGYLPRTPPALGSHGAPLRPRVLRPRRLPLTSCERVVYRRQDLDEWLKERRRSSTADPGTE